MDANRFSALMISALCMASACKSKKFSDVLPEKNSTSVLEGAVASDHAQASKAGAAILEAGGNAVDAAVVTALALGTVNPSSSGIGGGGFAVVYDAKNDESTIYDFREEGPSQISPESFKKAGVLDPNLSQQGGLAVAVPGEVKGLEQMWRAHGQTDWKKLLEDAAQLADSFYVSEFLAQALGRVVDSMPPDGDLRKWLMPAGRKLSSKQKVSRPNLAKTLRAIAELGSDGFYKGWVAEDMVAATVAYGGVMTLEDLRDYKVVEREPLRGRWNGLDIVTMPMPSSGGMLLLEMLGMLEQSNLNLTEMGAESADALQVTAELLKHAFADRARSLGYIDDAQDWTAKLLATPRLKELASKIKLDAVLSHDDYGDPTLGEVSASVNDQGTSHFCVVDGEGNAVALTTTVNGYFGSDIMAPKSGVVLNNEIDDFALQAGQPNMFGLIQGEANLVAPGRRPLSSMTPTLVFKDGEVVGCFGGSGGPRIISNTFQAILNVFAYGMNAEDALAAPRIHQQWLPDVIIAEDALAEETVQALVSRGQKVERSGRPTAVQAFVINNGKVDAASDPRKGGEPAYAKKTQPPR